MATVVECEMSMDLIAGVGQTLPVSAVLSYSSAAPYQVRITFREDGEEIATWVFCRELLLDGAFRPAGHGDVRVWPDRSGGRSLVCLGLNGPGGSSLLLAPAADVTAWNEQVCAVVPPGTEGRHIDLDRELAALLAG